jgi:glycosyltransferase involved in cell wall biosynthesis
MNIGLVIYGTLSTVSGGYLYDRKLVDYLREQGDTVEIISLPWRNYAAHLIDNVHFRLPDGLELLIQDELNHPSLIASNLQPHPYPVISLVHHLRCSEKRHPLPNAIYRWIETGYLRSVDGFIFNSETTRANVESIVGRALPHVVAHPPVDKFPSQITKQQVEERAAVGPLRVLFLGNVIPRKGLHTLLEAIRITRREVTLDVAGSLETDPTYASKMQQMTHEFRHSPQIRFHGSVSDQKLRSLLEAAHLLAVPSSYEGYGIAYLEGMGFGLPAIGTDAGAAREVIGEGKTGFLITPEDTGKLSEHLDRLAGDRTLLVEMSLNALNWYRQQPPWVESAARIREFLADQIEQFSKHGEAGTREAK